ncbi:T9SS type A sorting domain-containing protein [Fulvivirga sp. M361]|uniref:T9SS type A sorting domain-containing protein n=1 Tax=Fulvivirga sp. M361 TaxID=2594266 RepID=UPI00117B8577|nr:T9SS type A sorting domain-containing protein [Fulvivirga sp. M361]TRX58283.1 T9SS type A sorting domain-containing protein [Fulvivirga sp. M361]
MRRLTLFIFVVVNTSLLAQKPTITSSAPTTSASVRAPIILTSNAGLEDIDGTELLSANIGPLIIFRETDENGANVLFDAAIDTDKRVITITPQDILDPTQLYFIQLDSVRNFEATNKDTLEITTYTFTTGPYARVNNPITSGICVDTSAVTTLDPLVISEGIADNFINTSSSGNVHSLLLELPAGFEYVLDEGGITASAGDIESPSIAFHPDNDVRRIQVNYRLCPPPASGICEANTATLDTVSVTGLQVRVTDPNLDTAATYTITRVNQINRNDAELPALPPGSTFARMRLAKGPGLQVVDEDGVPIMSGTVAEFCAEESITLGVVRLDSSPITASDQLTFFANDVQLTSPMFNISGNTITLVRDNLIDAGIPLPFNFSAQLNRTGECIGLSNVVEVNTIQITGAAPSITMDGFSENQSLSPVAGFTDVGVSPLGGLLTILINGRDSIAIDNYQGDFQFSTDQFASNIASRNITIRYAAFESGCSAGFAVLRFTILPRPRIEEEIGVLPSYCEDDAARIPIFFRPPDLTDTTTISNLAIVGGGISGVISPGYDPVMQEDSTGFLFDVDAARLSLLPGVNSTSVTISYQSSIRQPIIDNICRTVTFTELQEECSDLYGCRPCFSFEFDCFQNQDKCEFSCEPNQRCEVIGTECNTIEVTRTRIECRDEITGFNTVVSDIETSYTIQFLSVPELEFRTVLREPVDTVFCVDSPPVFLLGGPGDTFANKRFSLLDLDTDVQVNLTDFSFNPSDTDLGPNVDGYRLFFDFLGDISNCENRDSLDFRIVPIPQPVAFPMTLPEVQNIPAYRYCLGDEVDSVVFATEVETTLIWRDDRGFELARGNRFLPPVITDQAGITRFTVERFHLLGGCTSGLTSFFIQVGETPEVDYSFNTDCNSEAFFTENVTHAGNILQNDTIRSFFWNFNDRIPTFISVPGGDTSHNFSQPGVYDVVLAVESSIGCVDTLIKKVTVFDQVAIDAVSNSYFEDFNNGNGGWIATSENNEANGQARNSSWRIADVLGQPAWVTSDPATGRFNNDEFSWVESPCVNLDQWTDPLLELDIHYNTQALEGVVLQYQIQEAVNTDWITLGDIDRGLNWYTSNSISAGPGGSIVGWAGVTDNTEWVRAAFNLSSAQQVAAGNEIRFRIAFASLDQGNRTGEFTGFSFDNVSIRDKDRFVLIEHFTNVTQADVTTERELVSDFSMPRNDVIYIQYHTEDGDDPFFYSTFFPRNTANDHLTRRFFYGFDGPGFSVMNGRLTDTTSFNAGWAEEQYSRESLTPSPFDIDINFSVLDNNNLQVNATAVRNESPNRLLDERQEDLSLSMTLAVIEKEVDFEGEILNNVFLQYLPFQGGRVASGQWRAGAGLSLEMEEIWQVHRDATAGEFSVVAIVQLVHGVEQNTFGLPLAEVFQAFEKSIDVELRQSEITSLGKALQAGIQFFPNPVSEELQVLFGDEVINEPVYWSILTLQGKEIVSGYIPAQSKSALVDVSTCDQGMYLIRLKAGKEQFQQRITVIK